MQEVKKVWLIKHPTSKYYEETQKQIKRLAVIEDVKIFDEKCRPMINADLVIDHKLTLKKSDEEKVAENAKAEKAAETKAKKEAEKKSAE